MESGKTKTNVTFQRLSGLPFKSAAELKQAQEEIRLQTWKRLEQAKAIDELTQREEFGFFMQEFKQGLSCNFENDEESLFRVFSPGKGIRINVNKELASADPANETLIGVLVKSVSESFAVTYYRAKGILPTEFATEEALTKVWPPKARGKG